MTKDSLRHVVTNTTWNLKGIIICLRNINFQKFMAGKKMKTKNPYYIFAIEFAKEFVKTQMKPFTSEQVKDKFHERNDEPNEPRVWGAIFKELKKEKLIIHHGYSKYKNPKGHQRPVSLWISREYSQKQKNCRKANSKTQINLFEDDK